ncbi:MAG: hypothetical protein R2838_02255 [Caldilineaceae bacterium]
MASDEVPGAAGPGDQRLPRPSTAAGIDVAAYNSENAADVDDIRRAGL